MSKRQRFPTFRYHYLHPDELEGVVADEISSDVLPEAGQLLIGQGNGLPPVAAVLTAGPGIVVDNGAGSVTVRSEIGSLTAGNGVEIQENNPGELTLNVTEEAGQRIRGAYLTMTEPPLIPYPDATGYHGFSFGDGMVINWFVPGSRVGIDSLRTALSLSDDQKTMNTGASATYKSFWQTDGSSFSFKSLYCVPGSWNNKTYVFKGYDADDVEVARYSVILGATDPPVSKIVLPSSFDRIYRFELSNLSDGTHVGGLSGAYVSMYGLEFEFPDREVVGPSYVPETRNDAEETLILQARDGEAWPLSLTAGANATVVNYPEKLVISADQPALPVQTDGQLLIGNGAAVPVAATLTAGPGININNGPGSVTIEQNLLQVQRVEDVVATTVNSVQDVLVTGMSLTLTLGGSYLVMFDSTCQHDRDARSSHVTLYLNGTPVQATQRESYFGKKEDVDHVGLVTYLAGVSIGDVLTVMARVDNIDTILSFYERVLILIRLAM